MPNKTKYNTKTFKPKQKLNRCCWVEGVTTRYISAMNTCSKPAYFDVFSMGVKVGRVCGKHGISATQHGWQLS